MGSSTCKPQGGFGVVAISGRAPADLIDSYPRFYWDNVSPHIQLAIRYLNITSSGRQWIASLYANVFRAERDLCLFGPQS